MLTLNEAHNIGAVLANLRGWAREVFVVDSFSTDETVQIATGHGAKVVQRRFRNFGDQWNFALQELPVTAPWTMKLDPDERLSDALKTSILAETRAGSDGAAGFSFDLRFHFMGRPLSVRRRMVRVWATGSCRFSELSVNEYPVINGSVRHIAGILEHHDSPDLAHWLDKQNRYTTSEAIAAYAGQACGGDASLFGTPDQRRRWLKRVFLRVPLRYHMLFIHHWLVQGAWRAGRVGWRWAWLRCFVYRVTEYKLREFELRGMPPPSVPTAQSPDPPSETNESPARG